MGKKLVPLMEWILVLSIFGGGVWFFSKNYLSKNTKTVRIGFTRETMEAMTVIAKEKGFFVDEGLDVTLVSYDIGKTAIDEGLFKNKIDIAPAATTPIVVHYIDQKPIRIIATMARANDQLKILVRKSSGIHIPADLKGKRIATQKGSAAHYFTSLFLEDNHINDSDVEMVFSNEVKQLPLMIADGKADAISIREPYLSTAKEKIGTDAALFASTSTHYKTFEYVTTNEFIKRNPKTLEKVMRALYKAEAYIKEHSDDALRIVSQYDGVSKEQIEEQWATTNFELVLDDILMGLMDDQSSWVVVNDLTENKDIPDLRGVIYSNALRSVKPQATFLDY